ncbi:MAG: hypothetical protein AAFR79_03560 [Pseudomonadota bacterium]
MAHWKHHREANETRIAQHRVRYGAVLPNDTGAGLQTGQLAPPDGYTGISLALTLGFAAFLGTLLLGGGFWLALITGTAVGLVALFVCARLERHRRDREAREAAEARAIREAETARQLAEFRASGGLEQRGEAPWSNSV